MRLFPAALDLGDEEVFPGWALFRVRQVGQVIPGGFRPGRWRRGRRRVPTYPKALAASLPAHCRNVVIAKDDDEAVIVDAPDKAPGNSTTRRKNSAKITRMSGLGTRPTWQ